ncbi:MAG TPA: DUF2231 domain-containing protein [Gemmatimonadales bacterium]|nr:DUF2231 domain-containing protein [Gemmatimonadales bacterium]
MFGYDWPRLHAALNDLPAALLLVAVLFDLAATALNRPSLRTAGFWTLVTGAAGAALAVISGLQAEEHIAHGEAVHRVMETHEELALITLGVFAVLAVWRIVRERRMGGTERTIVLAASLGGVGVLIATAVFGGKLVFDHAAGIPTEVLQAETHERSEGHHHGGSEAGESEDEAHEHGAPAPGADTTTMPTGSASASDSAAPAGHTHAPGTPPHKD